MKAHHNIVAVLAAAATRDFAGCDGKSSTAKNERAANAEATYVAPGEKDEYYLFYSGGHSGQVFVTGIPSMRHISRSPSSHPIRRPATASTRNPRRCWATSPGATCTIPRLSQTASKYDGRWLFVNDNANNRVARIDLRDFKTRQILGPIPNSSGNHGSSFVTENTEYLLWRRVSRCRCRKAGSRI